MDNKIEIIEFKNPTTERLRITKINWNDKSGEAGLNHLIRCKISTFGLVHSVIAKEELEDGNSSSNVWYAYVDMYSQKDIEKAYKYLKGKLLIESKVCKVAKIKGRRTDLPLAKDKCEALANYHLGFNGWTSTLLYHRHESSEPYEYEGNSDKTNESPKVLLGNKNYSGRNEGNRTNQNTAIQTEKFGSAIRLHIPHLQNGKVSVEGVGIGKSEWNLNCPEGKGKARAFASKQSKAIALQNAFSKILLVVLNGGEKVTAEVNLEKEDPFAYNPIWDIPSIVVNEVCYNDEEEEQELNDLDFKGISQYLNNL